MSGSGDTCSFPLWSSQDLLEETQINERIREGFLEKVVPDLKL